MWAAAAHSRGTTTTSTVVSTVICIEYYCVRKSLRFIEEHIKLPAPDCQVSNLVNCCSTRHCQYKLLSTVAPPSFTPHTPSTSRDRDNDALAGRLKWLIWIGALSTWTHLQWVITPWMDYAERIINITIYLILLRWLYLVRAGILDVTSHT